MSDIPDDVREYRSREYWERRYERESNAHYDWLLKYEQVEPLLLTELEAFNLGSCRLLHLGCGNSDFGERFHRRCPHITNTDFSRDVIDSMQRRCPAEVYPHMQWLVSDMLAVGREFAPESFDVCFDKGSLDAVWSDGCSQWTPAESTISDVQQIVRGVLRVLRPGGLFLSISFGQPHFRIKHYTLPDQPEVKYTLTSRQIGPIYYLYKFEKH